MFVIATLQKQHFTKEKKRKKTDFIQINLSEDSINVRAPAALWEINSVFHLFFLKKLLLEIS